MSATSMRDHEGDLNKELVRLSAVTSLGIWNRRWYRTTCLSLTPSLQQLSRWNGLPFADLGDTDLLLSSDGVSESIRNVKYPTYQGADTKSWRTFASCTDIYILIWSLKRIPIPQSSSTTWLRSWAWVHGILHLSLPYVVLRLWM
jgi:hypothetical protein